MKELTGVTADECAAIIAAMDRATTMLQKCQAILSNNVVIDPETARICLAEVEAPTSNWALSVRARTEQNIKRQLDRIETNT